MKVLRPVVVLVAVGLLAAGCSSTKSVSKSDVESTVKSQLAKSVGQTPKSVTCPGDLKGKVGTTMRCELTADDGTKIGLTLTVYEVKGSSAKFHIKVDDQVESGSTSSNSTSS